VLFSPGGGTSRVLYQATAEDLASHGYLVVAVDHTGEAPVELADGRILPPSSSWSPGSRLADMRLVLRRLDTGAAGARADLRRVSAIGHSLGGSTAAALMRAEPSVRAGVDIDGLVQGAPARHGVSRPFMVLGGDRGPLSYPGVRGLLEHSTGPRLALRFTGFEHFSFSDAPVVAPETLAAPSARDIAVQRAYLRAFLDRHLRDRPSRLLRGPSPRWPQVRFLYRRGW
jgi:alpha-beta hydrolase superfamily lysophospholipase